MGALRSDAIDICTDLFKKYGFNQEDPVEFVYNYTNNLGMNSIETKEEKQA